MRAKNLSLLIPVLIVGMPAFMLTALPVLVRADGAPSKKEAQSWYNTIAAAIKIKDIKPIEALSSPSMVHKMADGRSVTRAQWLSSIKSFKSAKMMTDLALTVQNVKMTGSNVIVSSALHVFGDVPDAQGKPHKLEIISPSQDTWTKTGGKWLLLEQKDISGSKTLVDGKPLPARPPK